MSTYTNDRNKFYSQFPEFWSNLYGSEYSLYHVYTITEQTHNLLKEATERMGRVFLKLPDSCAVLKTDSFLNLVFLPQVFHIYG